MGDRQISKYARKRKDKLIHKSDIHEEMKLIEGSNTDYITPTAKVYKDYGDDYYYPKKPYKNKKNFYLYVNVTFTDGKNKARRLHRLLAQAYIPNPDPLRLKEVGHKDNIKWHCTIDNLYWTTNKDNTQKAVDDKLNINDKGENDSQSTYIKVLENNKIVGIYGSIGQCSRCIKNSKKSHIARACKTPNYKSRSKKYCYQYATKEEFDNNKELQNKMLEENDNKNNKCPKVFRMVNKWLGYDEVLDNQVQASKICGIPQATISQLIRKNGYKDGWQFYYLDEILYKESSSYQNFIDGVDCITIRNINTNEILSFQTKREMLNYFGINGNDANGYVSKNFTIMHEWKVIDNIQNNNETNQKYIA